MIKRIALLAAFFLFMTTGLYADTITLKSGKQIEGNILSKSDDSVKIDIVGVEVTYFNDEIDKINDKPLVPPVEKVNIEVRQEAVEGIPGIPSESSLKIEATESQGTTEANIDLTTPAKKSSFKVSLPSQKIELGKKQQFLIASGLLGFFVIFGLIAYIYSSLCLYFIAKKTSKEPAWMAWVPIANLFLMCKIASISYWFLLILLLTFIPFLGFLTSIAFTGFVWHKIALARGKEGWIGILTCIPIVGLITMGYLAFSD